MAYATQTILAVAVLGFGLVSKRLQTSILSPPMAFTGLGLACALLIPQEIGLTPASPFVHGLAELTLILLLFTDASRIPLGQVWKDHNLPFRLLGISMPLTILCGVAGAMLLFPDMAWWSAVVLAVALAPTDAALGQAVVSRPEVPGRIRQTLNVESGLNDGLALPLFLLALSLAGAVEHDAQRTAWEWVAFAGMQVVLGPLAGMAVGRMGGAAVSRMTQAGWMDATFQRLAALALAVLAYGLADAMGGNGFIAAFVAGLTLAGKSDVVCERLHDFGEAEGQLMTLLVFFIFGAVLLPPALVALHWECAAYALASLTICRILPVFLAFLGNNLSLASCLFVGWFGPRGIASILFGLLILHEGHLEQQGMIWNTICIAVFFSVFLHGVTAYPLALRYGASMGAEADQGAMPEHRPVSDVRVRIRHD